MKTSVEFAHVCAGHDFTLEPNRSLVFAKPFLTKESCGAILIDDTNGPVDQSFIDRLDDKFMVCWEKSLQANAELVFQRLDKSTWQYFRKQNKHVAFLCDIPLMTKTDVMTASCSLLSATWYLCRLGIMPYSQVNVINPHTAEGLINVLPKNLERTELQTIEILSACGFKLPIETVYY